MSRLSELRLLTAHVFADGPFGFRGEIVGGAAHYEWEGSRWPLIRSAWDSFAWVFKALYCIATEHAWEDTSHAGPESGDMDMTCSRCNIHFHHQLY